MAVTPWVLHDVFAWQAIGDHRAAHILSTRPDKALQHLSTQVFVWCAPRDARCRTCTRCAPCLRLVDAGRCVALVQAMRDGDLPESVSLLELSVKGPEVQGLYLSIGTTNGVLYRAEVDRANGQLTEIRTR